MITTDLPLADFIAFVAANSRAGVATTSSDGFPEAALVDIVATDEGAVVFLTRGGSRKVTNLSAEPSVALVIGLEEVSMQVEGEAVLTADLARSLAAAEFEHRRPGSRAFDPAFEVIVVHPKWLRHIDHNERPPRKFEGAVAW